MADEDDFTEDDVQALLNEWNAELRPGEEPMTREEVIFCIREGLRLERLTRENDRFFANPPKGTIVALDFRQPDDDPPEQS